MNEKTLKALRQSVEKWRKNQEATRPGDAALGPLNCALCAMFRVVHAASEIDCSGCPVKERTGEDGCGGTPYSDAQEAHSDWCCEEGNVLLRSVFREASKDEVKFLESLLPEGELRDDR